MTQIVSFSTSVMRQMEKGRLVGGLLSLYPSQSQRALPYLNVGVVNLPRFEKRYSGGEDAYLISKCQRFVGVCDGVGGWEKFNINSGRFSRGLCKTMKQLYEIDED